MQRIEGALLPDSEVHWIENGDLLGDALDYVWICECTTKKDRSAVLWIKTAGMVTTEFGFVASWMAGDLGTLSAQANGKPKEYVLEFTGTKDGKARKHQETLIVTQENG